MLANSKLQSIICTTRLNQSVDFYRNGLGFSNKGISDGAVVFDVNGNDLRIAPVPSMTPSEHTVLGFSVPNVDLIVTTLTDHGIAIERFPGFPHESNGTLTTPEGSRVAWFRDPDGNLLSVVQIQG